MEYDMNTDDMNIDLIWTGIPGTLYNSNNINNSNYRTLAIESEIGNIYISINKDKQIKINSTMMKRIELQHFVKKQNQNCRILLYYSSIPQYKLIIYKLLEHLNYYCQKNNFKSKDITLNYIKDKLDEYIMLVYNNNPLN